jgi:hypothetical protein
VALKRYDEAEPLLLSSYALLFVKRDAQLPVREALARIVRLYEAWEKPAQLAEWQAKYAEATNPPRPSADSSTPDATESGAEKGSPKKTPAEKD